MQDITVSPEGRNRTRLLLGRAGTKARCSFLLFHAYSLVLVVGWDSQSPQSVSQSVAWRTSRFIGGWLDGPAQICITERWCAA